MAEQTPGRSRGNDFRERMQLLVAGSAGVRLLGDLLSVRRGLGVRWLGV